MDASKQELVTAITACRACGEEGLESLMNFGHLPLANRYLLSPDDKDIYAPLELVLCKNCCCVQLRHTVDPKVLFGEYLYASSVSGSLAEHFKEYAQETTDKLGFKPGDEPFIVGIGGNDGCLEREYQRLGFKVLNVEPSDTMSKLSERRDIPTIQAWFDEATAVKIVTKHGRADVVTCNHCFAHMPDINGVVRGVKALLKPGGTFIFEEAYWPDTVAGSHFDQIYHEHVFYWTLHALEELFFRHDMKIGDVQFRPEQGGSIRVFVRNERFEENSALSKPLTTEVMSGMYNPSVYRQWWEKIMAWRTKCRDFLRPLESISCYGVPAKFTMISEELGFSPKWISYAVEDSPIKVGRFTPGSHIPIVARSHFIEHPAEHCIITAGNYTERIIEANPQYKGKWITLHPEARFL
jgi:SAM-dependent methyltransferase